MHPDGRRCLRAICPLFYQLHQVFPPLEPKRSFTIPGTDEDDADLVQVKDNIVNDYSQELVVLFGANLKSICHPTYILLFLRLQKEKYASDSDGRYKGPVPEDKI